MKANEIIASHLSRLEGLTWALVCIFETAEKRGSLDPESDNLAAVSVAYAMIDSINTIRYATKTTGESRD